jgi:fatty-acyl-CoA synthase
MPHAHASLPKNPANHVPLSPLSFLRKAAEVFPDHPAVVYDGVTRSWAETASRCRRLASALVRAGLGPGDTVAVLAANTPELYEAHFGVPMAGGVLAALNIRLDARTIGYILDHCEARFLITDKEFSPTVKKALELSEGAPKVLDIDDPAAASGDLLGYADYEAFLATGDSEHPWALPEDEWDALAINYTSGTTGDPKGVVYHHRGAYLNAVGNTLEWAMPNHPRYLWTLPMFHCNGWCFPWTIAAKAGTNICLRKVTAKGIYDAIADRGADHLCGAPIVLGMMINPGDARRDFSHRCKVMTAAAPPPAAVLQKMQEQGFDVTHVYGLTEVYGPAVACAWHAAWSELPVVDQARLKARQGVAYLVQEEVTVADPASLAPVPADGSTIGEVLMRGNIAMKGYLKDPDATARAFAGGWFHTGDLAVRHLDGYLELKDRAKDIIISGGENISSIEVENALMAHPAVALAAVVARPDPTWGETPCAFVELHPGAEATEAELIAHCRGTLAHFKCPRTVVFQELPKTSTGKIQKGPLRTVSAGL